MRARIVLGTALTGAVLAMVAGVIGGLVAADQLSVDGGVGVRAFLVVAALAVTAVFWWLRMEPGDRPEALFAGLMGAWLLAINTWNGHGFVAQVFTDSYGLATVIDLVLWAAVSYGLVAVLVRTSTPVRS